MSDVTGNLYKNFEDQVDLKGKGWDKHIFKINTEKQNSYKGASFLWGMLVGNSCKMDNPE